MLDGRNGAHAKSRSHAKAREEGTGNDVARGVPDHLSARCGRGATRKEPADCGRSMGAGMTRLLITVFAVQLLILWALRPLVWWYFGIDRALEHLSSIDVSLRTLPTVERYDNRFDRR